MHAGDNGIGDRVLGAHSGFGSNSYLYANKLDSNGNLLWGSGHVHVFDGGSLQFGELPYFSPDGSGGAVFSWYSNSPSLQVYAQAYPGEWQRGISAQRLGRFNEHAAHKSEPLGFLIAPRRRRHSLFWTEQNSLQSMAGVWGQKFNSAGTRQWSDSGLVIVPLNNDSENWVENVQIGTGALVFWVDSPGFGTGTIQATKLDGTGTTVCAQFPISTASANKSRLFAGIASSGLSALAWEDDRNGENDIFVQNVNPDCTLGVEDELQARR